MRFIRPNNPNNTNCVIRIIEIGKTHSSALSVTVESLPVQEVA